MESRDLFGTAPHTGRTEVSTGVYERRKARKRRREEGKAGGREEWGECAPDGAWSRVIYE